MFIRVAAAQVSAVQSRVSSRPEAPAATVRVAEGAGHCAEVGGRVAEAWSPYVLDSAIES